jgi:hypothetical protein
MIDYGYYKSSFSKHISWGGGFSFVVKKNLPYTLKFHQHFVNASTQLNHEFFLTNATFCQ